MSEETWLPVPHYGKRYEVSNLGRVRSYLRPGGRGFIYSEPRPVVHIKKRSGYVVVSLMGLDGKQKKKPVHRLVALAFMPGGPQIHWEAESRGQEPNQNSALSAGAPSRGLARLSFSQYTSRTASTNPMTHPTRQPIAAEMD